MFRVNIIFRLVPFGIALLIVVADRITKLAIQHSLGAGDGIAVLPGWLRIIHIENPGAAFGVLAEGNAVVRSAVLIGVSAIVLVFVASAVWNRNSTFSAATTRFGLGLILGGAVGNLFDRALRGTVTDFVEVYHGLWSFPAFNVADSAITVGAVLLVIDLLLAWRKRATEQAGFAHK